MKFEIKDRWTGTIIFTADLDARYEIETHSIQLGAAIRAAVKAGAYLAGADLAGADLAGADLADTDLAVADLAGANLAGAKLAGANLARANLTGANLAGADLAGANLAGAHLARANLAGADLAGANLADANLAGADLAGADLAGAQWRHGIVLKRTPIQLYNLDNGWRVTILDEHMEIGCELHSFDEWAAFTNKEIATMDRTRALRFWRRWKPALMAVCEARKETATKQAAE